MVVRVVLLSTALLCLSCSDSTGPDDHLVRFAGGLVGVAVPTGLSLCSQPVWFAYKNDGEAWIEVTPDAMGEIAFEPGPRVTVAFITEHLQQYRELNVLSLAHDELRDLECSFPGYGNKRLSGTLSGQTVADAVPIVGMAANSSHLSAGMTDYSFGALPDGPLDLVAVEATSTNTVERFVIRRDISLPDGGTIGNIDFTSDGFTPTSASASVSGGTGVRCFYQSYRAPVTHLEYMASCWPLGAAMPAWHVPETRMLADELHRAQVLEIDAGPGIPHRLVGTVAYYRAASSLSFTLPASASEPTITIAGTAPHLRPAADVTSHAELSSAAGIYLVYATSLPTRAFRVMVTSAYLGATPATWHLEVPDMSGAPGFSPAWGIEPQPDATLTEKRLTMVSGRFGLVYPFNARPYEGDAASWALWF